MITRNFGLALVAGVALATASIAGFATETTTLAVDESGCTTSYAQNFDTAGSPVSLVTLSCPRLPVQVAATGR